LGRDEPITNAFHRFVKLGGLIGRVGVSMAGAQISDLARGDTTEKAHTAEAMVRNATRIVETLGRLKGAAMKVGQMLSLHEGLLPPEVAAVLSTLQKEAPRVPPEVMEYEARGQLKNFDELFERLDLDAFAAASIGQVHRGRLRDGRRVAVKIQYPGIDHIIEADLKNLRTILRRLFSLISKVDFDPVWREVRDRLLEELDYTHEAENMRRMAALHADIPEIIIPRVIDEASTRGVLTMQYVRGISPELACSNRYDQKLKDRWAKVLFEFQFRGLFEHRFMHADPNLANFSFLEDGRVIVYDFGCVKRIPQKIVAGYSELILAGLLGRTQELPRILLDLGVYKGDHVPLPMETIEPYIGVFSEIYREAPPYTFGQSNALYRQLFDLGMSDLPDAIDLHFPEDVVFIDRSLGGHFGNLGRLRATGPWRDIVLHYAEQAAGITST
jgi:predicted unusual protein kinase regulating ubiquinone biosynthesis (AarF/ABC1/UbiB family)